MKLGELKELLELIEERNIIEFELEEAGVKLRIKKGGTGSVTVASAGMMAVADATRARLSQGAAPNQDVDADGDELDGLAIVKAPMVGTFYRQPEPGAEPFAAKGQQIKKGQVLCIIEAMKLMNEIEAELSGEIVDVFVEDGHAVQFGDKLFAVREA